MRFSLITLLSLIITAPVHALDVQEVDPTSCAISSDYMPLSGTREKCYKYQTAERTIQHENYRWASDRYRAEITFSKAVGFVRFKAMGIEQEIRGYRFFSHPQATLEWGEAVTIGTTIGKVQVKLVTARYTGRDDVCAGLLSFLGRHERLSAYFCDFTGRALTTDDIVDFLQHIRVKGAFESLQLRE